jgi:hypothetical protein
MYAGLIIWSPYSLSAQSDAAKSIVVTVQSDQGKSAGVQQSSFTISGRVLDASGAAVAGARVSLNLAGKPGEIVVMTGLDGGFSIAISNPGRFNIGIIAPGFGLYQTSGETQERENITLPDIALRVAAVSTEVQVAANTNEVAMEQVRAEEKQRILGLVPNYYVSYNQDTAPLRPKQKFSLARRFTLDPVSFGIVGIIAGVRQANNTYTGYGQGAQGYGKRYAAAYGDFLTGVFISNAILPSLFRQDPRYFYRGTGSKQSRILYAMANSVICKGDNGHWQPNYSNIFGSLASGGISNAYYPAKDRNGAALTFENAGINIGANAAADVVQEFLFKKLTPHVPKNSAIKP